MQFKHLAQFLSQLEQTSSSNEMIILTADFISRLEQNEIAPALYLTVGRLGPLYDRIEFGISEKLVMRSIAQAFSLDLNILQKQFKTKGDLGDVAEALATHPKKGLSILEVYEQLVILAKTSGKGSIEGKVTLLADMYKSMSSIERKYITRIILERLRTGLAEAKILDALSWVLVGDKSLRGAVEDAYNVLPDIGRIAELCVGEGVESLKAVSITPGIPIRPAQSERLPTPEKIVEKLSTFAVEPKMDGFRVQVHVFGKGKNRQVKLYSRNLNETTHMFPDIVAAAAILPVDEAIFDSEALAFNPDTNEFLPFQETVKRRRKHEIEKMQSKVPLRVFLFDVLYLNGKSLLYTPAQERFDMLSHIDLTKQTVCHLTRHHIVDSVEKLRELFDLYISEGLEGIMCKKLDAEYQAGSRNFNWVKYKRATEQSLADTVDAVVMGYYAGQGQRNRFGIGAFLVGVYDEETGTFKTLAKIGTGLSDEQWRDMKQRLDVCRVDDVPKTYVVHQNLAPDVWTLPKVVVEVAADEITRSPIHTAAKREDSLDGSGLALRFPRLVRVRDDKDPFDTTKPTELLSIYQN